MSKKVCYYFECLCTTRLFFDNELNKNNLKTRTEISKRNYCSVSFSGDAKIVTPACVQRACQISSGQT